MPHRAAGVWQSTRMEQAAAVGLSSQKRLPSRRAKISEERRKLAARCKIGDIIALEAHDDQDGFVFWLAEVTFPSSKWASPTTTKDRVKLKKGGYYISVKIIDRFPSSDPSTFKLDPEQEQ